ncbi:hypothetical protein AB205_0198700 [Aquarana catesbeiana]|uniref:Uncharacterized protein n=1 Tax=Aquarana catesbeiana TaxID=8400 RepID=A0A2G9RSW4_AQUCT|nr:hypothetical protein AB205_0198700 [Aquarana catesbeiana]
MSLFPYTGKPQPGGGRGKWQPGGGGISGSQEVAGPSSLPESQFIPLGLPQKSSRKRSNLKKAAIGLFLKTAALRTPPASVQEDYAYMTACKMLEMEEGQRLLCPLPPLPPPATPPTPEPQPGRKRVR